MALKLANNATSRLAVAVSASETSVILQAGDGAKFPALSAGDWFPVTALRSDNSREIMYVTARSGDVLTVSRAQENTAPLSFSITDRIELRTTAGVLGTFLSRDGGAIAGSLTVQDKTTPTKGFVYLGNGGAVISFDGADYRAGSNKLLHTGNLDLSSKADLAGATFTGKINTAGINSAMAAGGDATSSLEVRNVSGGTGDGQMAMMSFVAQGSYGIKMGVRADGYFGIGGLSRAAWSWYTSATGDMVSAGNVSAYSDPRLKNDVAIIAGALDIIKRLDGVRFTWNNKTTLIGIPGRRDIGILADQVEAVLPEIVGRSIPDLRNDGEQWRIVAYDKIIPVLIEAVKELAAKIEAQ